jgi:hypothetical protein
VPPPPAPPPLPPPPPEDEWVSVHDTARLWQLAQANSATATTRHPDAQPVPPGVFDFPPAVLASAAHEESAAAAAAAAPYGASISNERLVRSCWPSRHDHPSCTLAPMGALVDPWAQLCRSSVPRRLVVLCGATLDSVRHHPLMVEHAAALVSVAAISDDECATRGGCDAYADLWEALEAGAPLVVFEVVATTRRLRKQLLFRLSKQPAAAAYVWEALSGTDEAADRQGGGKESAPPTVEEGWSAVLA